MNTDQNAFFALLRAGLWNNKVRLATCGGINLNEVYHYAEEQSVLGLVAAGVEHLQDIKVPQETALKYAGRVIQIEQRNKAMNQFIGQLFSFFKKNEISAVLVKGQGIAQCYERPLWRESGDIDLLFDIDNYEKAKIILHDIAQREGTEIIKRKHQDYTIESWKVELHGSMRNGLWKRMDEIINDVQYATCSEKEVRIWEISGINIFLPNPNNDIILTFTHILQHFFHMGIGLRQICDWCRLLWTFRESINVELLNNRLQTAGLITEWKAFAALAVGFLGMPAGAMPLYSSDKVWQKKAERIRAFILKTGNFGQNIDMSYQTKYPSIVAKLISLVRSSEESLRRFIIFPKDSTFVWLGMIVEGVKGLVFAKK